MLEQIDKSFGYIVSFLESILFSKPMDVIEGIFSFPFIVLILLVGSIIFTLYFKFINIRGFKHSIDVIRGKYDNPDDIGEISHFQALTSALSATIGLGNIAGVAVAVSLGGPGAVFWMMFIAIFSMSAKFVSATLAQIYRRVNKDGTINGGPMYYLSIGLKEKKLPLLGKILATLYAIFIIGGALGGGNMFQANQSFELVANRFTFFQIEKYKDIPNGIWDPGEKFNDCGLDNICIDKSWIIDGKPAFQNVDKDYGEGNGKYDLGEFFNDLPNNKYDPPETFTDLNDNGKWDKAEIYYDCGIDQYCCYGNEDCPEDLLENNGKYDFGEKFDDSNNNNKYDPEEKYNDKNKNNRYDIGEEFKDIGNGIYDKGEYFTDSPLTKPQQAEEYIDKNGNGIYDGDILIEGVGAVCGNGIWDKGERFFDGRFIYPDLINDTLNASSISILSADICHCTISALFNYDLYDYIYLANPNGVYDNGELFIDECDGNYNEDSDTFLDINRNGKYDSPEEYTDKNNNGFYDYATRYIDISGDLEPNDNEFYIDQNENNLYDCNNGDKEECEHFNEKLDGIYTSNDILNHNHKNIHYYVDTENNIYNYTYDAGEKFIDIGNGIWDDKSYNSLIYGLILVVIVGLVIIGGISRIAKVTEKVVPLMVGTYVAASLWIILTHINKLPSVISQIFGEAFSPDAIYGGFLGVLIIGVQRAVFSNEGGVGSASIAHSAAKTDEPVREGIVAMIGPFIDTIVICFMTASVILITADINPSYQVGGGINGASLTSNAFGSVISWFPWILAIVVFLFSYSTMISWYYYGDKGWKYLFGNNKSIHVFQIIYLLCILLGTFASLGNVIGFSDLMILSCAVPNIIGAMFLLPKIKVKLIDYWDRYKNSEFQIYK